MITNRKIALLGALVALNILARMFGPGFAGVEPIFAMLILQGFVFRARFGFLLGLFSLFTSAILTAGFGPWLPFQMFGAAVVAGGAGLLPQHPSKRLQILLLTVYGFFAAYLYGAIVTLWQWPLLAGSSSALSYLPQGTFSENFWRFAQYSIVSGGVLWDTGRAVTTVVILVSLGKTILAALERAANRVLESPARRFAKSPARQR